MWKSWREDREGRNVVTKLQPQKQKKKKVSFCRHMHI